MLFYFVLQQSFKAANAEAKHAQQLVHESIKEAEHIVLKDLSETIKAETSTAYQRALSLILLKALPMVLSADGLHSSSDANAPPAMPSEYPYL